MEAPPLADACPNHPLRNSSFSLTSIFFLFLDRPLLSRPSSSMTCILFTMKAGRFSRAFETSPAKKVFPSIVIVDTGSPFTLTWPFPTSIPGIFLSRSPRFALLDVWNDVALYISVSPFVVTRSPIAVMAAPSSSLMSSSSLTEKLGIFRASNKTSSLWGLYPSI